MKTNAFEKIIGYSSIKKELLQLCDMVKNRDVYEKLGAKLPQGILLYGDPGLGKTLMAKCFIEESGLEAYVVRRNKGNDDFIADITETFQSAKAHAPSIVFLDDMDKFANEDRNHCDAEEYVAVQSGIDEVKHCDVFVLATVNNLWKLPKSLKRSGRFDRKIEVKTPNERDAKEIIAYYLSDKAVSDDVNMDDLVRMISYSSCAELETILNEAAIRAAYERKAVIEMSDLVKAVLRMEYNAPDTDALSSAESRRKKALHEAGHLVVSEILCAGSVGLASIRDSEESDAGGFIHRCKRLGGRVEYAQASLAGKAAVELYYADPCTCGCVDDINRAFTIIRDGMAEEGTLGFGMIDVATERFSQTSESLNARGEAVTQAELERYMLQTRNILLNNRKFLERATEALLEKETLLFSDIQKLRSACLAQEGGDAPLSA